MPYITFEEFVEITDGELFDKGLDEEEFSKYRNKAEALLDNLTSHFYHRFSMEIDNTWRVKQFKKALCAQIEYFHVLGASTYEEINSTPQTFTAGRTSVSNASRYNPSGANESKSLIAEEVFMHLEGTGLLYAGVAVRRG